MEDPSNGGPTQEDEADLSASERTALKSGLDAFVAMMRHSIFDGSRRDLDAEAVTTAETAGREPHR